ncbi:MAG: peptidylprolyl isomerase [Candidatus Cloacimonetes bacterium]|nr:peptidylprolyl isomerase [Candidatus Cloacimonadota bacterium]
MKYLVLIILIMVSTMLIAEELVDQIVAKVGREVILRSDLVRQMQQMEQLGLLEQEMTELDMINEMVESRLILQTAKDKNYRLDEYRIRQMIDTQINNQISRIGSETLLRAELQKAGMSLSDLRDYYDQMIREQRLREMIIQNEITDRVHITEAEVEEYYYDNIEELPLRLEMIELGLIRKEIIASERTKKRVLAEINRIYDRLREGEDFGALAKEYSDCPSAERRGDLGFFGPGTMIKEFEDVAFALKPGEISRVVETQFGYHIIKMEERDEEDIRVRHILKMIEPTDEDITQIMTTMEDLLVSLRDGADFQELATTYSDDDTAEQGGIIGEFPDNEFPEMFNSYINSLEIGEYTDIIREGNNLFVFTKVRIIPQRVYQLDEIREELREFLHTHKQIEHFDRWIKNLRDNSYVEIFYN